VSDRSDNERKAVWELTVLDEGFFEHFSDAPTWSAARSLWWLLLDSEHVRVSLNSDDSEMSRQANWQGALDLLAFGKGWVQIPQELGWWRQAGYPHSDPILRFIAINFGESIAYLELYLKLYAEAELAIRAYLLPHGDANSELEVISYGADDINDLVSYVLARSMGAETSAAVQHARVFMPWLLQEKRKIFNNENLRSFDSGGWDPSHMSPHFSSTWVEASTEFEPGDTIEVISASRWRVEFARYTHWYHKLTQLLTEDQWSQFTDTEPQSVDVIVNGVGYLGTFVHDESSGRLVRQIPESFIDATEHDELPTHSTRFGFPITDEMALAMLEAEPDEFYGEAEGLEMCGRDGIGLIFNLAWGANTPRGVNEWSRHEGQWVESSLMMEGLKFTSFLKEMVTADALDLEVPVFEAVIDESTIHDIEPWAAQLLLAEWDKPTPFPLLYAELGSLPKSQLVTKDELDADVWKLLTTRVGEIFPRGKPDDHTDDQLDLFDLVFVHQGSMTVQEVLNILITGERKQS
jgi:hypothetical protein